MQTAWEKGKGWGQVQEVLRGEQCISEEKGVITMGPLRLSPNEAVTLLSGIGAFIWAIKVFCIKWQNERLRQANKQLRRELR